jgi:CheY-like chemotaxis protein
MKRVLIVDDAIDLGRLLQDALKTVHPDIPISVVPSAEEALLEATRFTLDVLVTDLRLPGMSGLDLIRKIRVRQPNVKVILMTGLRPDDRLYKQKDEATVDIFLRKPIMAPDFLDAVDQLLGEGKPQESPVAKPGEEKPATEKPKPGQENPQPKIEKQADAAGLFGESASKKTASTPEAAALLRELAAVMPGEAVEAAPKPTPRRATGMLKLDIEPQAQPADSGLSGVLSKLRTSLGALTTMLLDERGKPVAQAGDLPNLQVEEMLAPPLMASLSAGAKISYLLGQTTSQVVQAYRGPSIDLVVAPAGQYVLLVVLQAGRSALRLALAFEEALDAQAEVSTVLEGMGLRVQTTIETGAPESIMAELAAGGDQQRQTALLQEQDTPLGQDPGLEKFEELFKKKKTGELRMPDADSFWDTISTGRSEVNTPGVLTFEQAQKLGLFPPETKE